MTEEPRRAGAPSLPGPLGRRMFLMGGLAATTSALLAACTSNTPSNTTSTGPTSGGGTGAGSTTQSVIESSPITSATTNPEGKMVKIGFSAPAADHGWMAAITANAKKIVGTLKDVEANFVDGTNDVNQQISQVETFINAKVDAIVLLPFDGAQMTDVARKATDAGIQVVNVDRIFSSPFAYRTYIGGDNYGMGVSAGTYIGQTLKDKGVQNPVIAEIQGIASLPLTQDRSKGFAEALKTYGFKVSNQVSAEFTADSGNSVTANLLQAALADFMDEGHFATHIRRMCKIYAARHDVLIEASRRRLDGLLDILPTGTGFHTVGRLAQGLAEQEVSAAAALRDISVSPIGRYCIEPVAWQGLVLGFSTIKPPEIAAGVETLAQVLEAMRHARRA